MAILQPRTEYLKTQVMTASPEMLTLMLWDGAIRFAEQGREAILKKDIEGSYKALVRSQKIIMEMSASLRHEVNPDLCQKMAALYNYMYRKLVEGNLQKEPKPVEEALELMRHQRETWVMLMEKLAKERAAEAVATAQENGEAIQAAEALSAAALQTPPASALPAAAKPRTLYPGLALKPARPQSAGLSVQV